MARIGKHFVGREQEQELISRSLSKPVHDRSRLIHLHGPSGIGKTSLLRRGQDICQALALKELWLDLRTIDPSPQAFLTYVKQVLGLPETSAPEAIQKNLAAYAALFFDTYNTQSPLDSWLRENFLPEMAPTQVILIASIDPLNLRWSIDSFWEDRLTTLRMKNLSQHEAQHYLREIGIHDDALAELTHGFPLALSLAKVIATQNPRAFSEELQDSLIQKLTLHFLSGITDDRRLYLLETAAVARAVTIPMLRSVLSSVAPDLNDREVLGSIDWLISLPFIESESGGELQLHDLLKDLILHRLDTLFPDRRKSIHRIVRMHYHKRIQSENSQVINRIVWDLTYLHRTHPSFKQGFAWNAQLNFQLRPIHKDDIDGVIALLHLHGRKSYAQAFALNPAIYLDNSWLVSSFDDNGKEQIAGALLALTLDKADSPGDPAFEKIQAHAAEQNYDPARTIIFREWICRDDYQGRSPAQNIIFIQVIKMYLKTEGLQASYLVCSKPHKRMSYVHYGRVWLLPASIYAQDDVEYAAFHHDWISEPPLDWLARLGEAELEHIDNKKLVVSVSPAAAPVHPDISEEDLSRQLKELLGAWHSPDRCAQNFLHGRRALVERKIVEMEKHPKEWKWGHALRMTYLEGNLTQEAAAEKLGFSFSSYRRHLAAGTGRLAEMLYFTLQKGESPIELLEHPH